jgi:hypothetical protein
VGDTAKKKWMKKLRNCEDTLHLTRPTLFYTGIAFHPLVRGDEDRVPIFISWVDLSGGAEILKKKDIFDGNVILLKLDLNKETLQAFKPCRTPCGNQLSLDDYSIAVEIPSNVRSRITFYETFKSQKHDLSNADPANKKTRSCACTHNAETLKKIMDKQGAGVGNSVG